MNNLALLMADAIFSRLRMIPGKYISRSTSAGVILATRSGSKSRNASRYPSLFLRMVIQLNPACAPSRIRNSNSFLSSVTNLPHSSSWYRTYNSSAPHHPHRPLMISVISFFSKIRFLQEKQFTMLKSFYSGLFKSG